MKEVRECITVVYRGHEFHTVQGGRAPIYNAVNYNTVHFELFIRVYIM